MKLTNLTVKDLITPDTKLTFLIGAGCSVDPPSCLPAGRTMMDAIIDYMCAETEIDKIKELKDLRFEQLVEIIRDQSDPDLRIIDLYELSDKPNIQHFFLANMIKEGSFVITTNFDFLIEYALQQSGVSLNDILPVITKQDFIDFQNPYKQLKKGKYTLYKIHGSTKNIIQDKSTRDSLIATLQAFGANKKEENVFQLESFKQPAFTNLTENRSLVVMGYSGSDDFDIVPTLKVLRNLENIIWINYVADDGGKESIYELTADIIGKPGEVVDKVNQILGDILRFNNKVHVYRVDTNTSRLVEDLLDTKPALSSDKFSINIGDWLKESIKLDLVKFRERDIPVPIQILKYYTSYRIYQDLNVYDHAERCLETIIEIAKEKGEDYWRATAIYEMGQIS
ncbi:MAG: SIR2 family protein, partial [Promethearchaeota archaeon]